MPVKNIIECNNPPGGQIVCEPNQIAVCGVIEGVIRRECLDPPSGGSPTSLINWTLGKITNEYRNADTAISINDLHTLSSGSYTSPTGDVVKFIIPSDMAAMVRLLLSKLYDSNSGSGSLEM